MTQKKRTTTTNRTDEANKSPTPSDSKLASDKLKSGTTEKKTAATKQKHIITKKQAEDELKKVAQKVTEDDVKKVLDKREVIERKFQSKGPLSRFVADAKLMFSLVQDYANGKYRKIPFWTVAAVVAALLYVLSPIDLIPDFIPVVGSIDDALVVTVCLSMVEKDLHAYMTWKAEQE